jgi:hypothetical protein
VDPVKKVNVFKHKPPIVNQVSKEIQVQQDYQVIK